MVGWTRKSYKVSFIRSLEQVSKALSFLVLPLKLCLRQCLSLPSLCPYPVARAGRQADVLADHAHLGAGAAQRRPDRELRELRGLPADLPLLLPGLHRLLAVRQRSSLLKAVTTAFPCVSLPLLAVPLRSHRTVAIREASLSGAEKTERQLFASPAPGQGPGTSLSLSELALSAWGFP
eukprot:SAG22_NODE_2844_length_2161_cov_4.195441_4_plen_178_part_00